MYPTLNLRVRILLLLSEFNYWILLLQLGMALIWHKQCLTCANYILCDALMNNLTTIEVLVILILLSINIMTKLQNIEKYSL